MGLEEKKITKKGQEQVFLKLFSKEGSFPDCDDELFLPCMTMSKNTTLLEVFLSELGWI